jgi:hypothetical protein
MFVLLPVNSKSFVVVITIHSVGLLPVPFHLLKRLTSPFERTSKCFEVSVIVFGLNSARYGWHLIFCSWMRSYRSEASTSRDYHSLPVCLTSSLIEAPLPPPPHTHTHTHTRGCIQKFPDWVDNEINNNNKHSLRSNTKGYGGETH